MREFRPHRGAPLDQAHGLRQLFAARRMRFVPLVHNPHVAFGGVAMERLCAAFGDAGLHTLVVDAADTASAAHELAQVDLSACVEKLSAEVSYLAARGLPMRWLDARGTTGGFLAALADAAPRADVVLVHAGASDLARLFARRMPRPILQAADRPESVTHAYASMKLLSQRLGVLAFDLLVAADAASPRVPRIAESLADCADRFLGAAVGDWALADPTGDPDEPVPAPLRRLAAAQLGEPPDAAGAADLQHPPAATPAARGWTAAHAI
jgi:hypothetical protein